MEHNCDICGKPATVHITKIVNGKKTKLHLCAECAQKGSALNEALPSHLLPNIKKLEEQILDIANPRRSELVCPTCGTTLSAFDKRGRFSCPDCYEAFKSKTEEMLAHMHGAVSHKGKVPKRAAASKRRAAENDDGSQPELSFEAKPKEVKIKFEDIKFQAAPLSPQELITELKGELARAVKDERYEDAASIRDKINKLEKSDDGLL